ncbi:MAG: glycosyltransferase [Metamycoplasmataceae bacterium]
MKILILTEHTHNRMGGIETYTRLIAEYFHSQNFEIFEYSLNFQNNNIVQPEKKYITQLNKIQWKNNPQSLFANRMEIEKIYNDFDLVINQINNFPWSKKIYKSKKWIFVQHFSPKFYKQHFIMGKFFAPIIYFLMWIFKFKNPFKNFQNLIVFSNEDKKSLGIKKNKNVFIIPNCKYKIEEINQFELKKTNNNKFIYLGRINNHQKRVNFIQKTVGKKHKIDFYGEGNVSLIHEDANIKYMGALNSNEVSSLLFQYKWMVLLSRFEGFPFTLVESLSCGVPILISNSFESAKFLVGDHSFLVKNSKKNIDKALEQMNKLSLEEYNKLSKKCFEFAKKELSLESFYKNWNNVIKKLLTSIKK